MAIVNSTMHVPRPSRLPAYLDWLQMLSGAALILFMWSHMILVSSVIIGPGVMDALAHFFELTYMAQIGGPAIGIVFLVHFFLAARKIPFRFNEKLSLLAQIRTMNHRDTWLWVVQAGSAMIILIMGAIHMWVVLTDLPITAAKSAERIGNGWWLLFYLILLPLVELHVSIGFYRIGVKWGFIRRANRAKGKKLELYLTIGFLVIGLITLARFYFLAP